MEMQKWVFDNTIEGYDYLLDGIKMELVVGDELRIEFEDFMRVKVPCAKVDDDKYKAAHRYIFHFRHNVYSIRIVNFESSGNFEAVIGKWLKTSHIQDGSIGVYRIKNSDYIQWIKKTDICGLYDTDIDMTHYMFVTEDQLYEVIDNQEPTIEVIAL